MFTLTDLSSDVGFSGTASYICFRMCRFSPTDIDADVRYFADRQTDRQTDRRQMDVITASLIHVSLSS
jgi:hypothetical protein